MHKKKTSCLVCPYGKVHSVPTYCQVVFSQQIDKDVNIGCPLHLHNKSVHVIVMISINKLCNKKVNMLARTSNTLHPDDMCELNLIIYKINCSDTYLGQRLNYFLFILFLFFYL